MENVPEFRRLSELRQMSWQSSAGDQAFRKQRKQADRSKDKTAKYFYSMMVKIAKELDTATRAFHVPTRSPITILDFCMAPGGFLKAAMTSNPGSRARCFSLPISLGGHKVHVPKSANITVKFLDITMLAADMGVAVVPENHPDAENFQSQQFDPEDVYDLVICDGHVLRTHARAEYREAHEAYRLTASQLALGLEHLNPGGTMIVLLHKVEAGASVALLHRFSQFSTLKLFKPTSGHSTRSSFYMVASNVQSRHSKAVDAVERWKQIWKTATFGAGEEYEESLQMGSLSPSELLSAFGEDLVELGKPIWNVQAGALANASFIKAEQCVKEKSGKCCRENDASHAQLH